MEKADAPETVKRGRGNPNMRPGGSSLNPSGKRKLEDETRTGDGFGADRRSGGGGREV